MLRCSAALLLTLTVLMAGCARPPAADGLRDSFAAQLAANTFVSEFQRSGDNMTFKAPRPDGEPAMWRVHINTAVVEKQDSKTQPWKGTVTSSWFVNGEEIVPRGTDSNLPLELTSNGLGQECWAFWEADKQLWSWE